MAGVSRVVDPSCTYMRSSVARETPRESLSVLRDSMSIYRDVERQLRETRLWDLAHHCMWAGRDTPSPTVGPHSDTLGAAIVTPRIHTLGVHATGHSPVVQLRTRHSMSIKLTSKREQQAFIQ